MSAPTPLHDLGKLRIDRDSPTPGVKRALIRNAIFAVIVFGAAAGVFFVIRERAAVPVQTIVAAASGDVAGRGGGGATSVTANGYIVAQTRASVSSKVPGRLAYLGVREGSQVTKGEVIARLENADYEAQVAEATANLANSRAQQVETEADRDQQRSDAERLRGIRKQNAQLVSQQEVDAAETRLATAEARVRAAAAFCFYSSRLFFNPGCGKNCPL